MPAKKKSKQNSKSAAKGSRQVARRAARHIHKRVKPHAQRAHGWYKGRPRVQKALIWLLLLILLYIGGMYGIARWYIAQNGSKAMDIGVTFIPRYARYFELDPQQTMKAIIEELGVRHFRLVSYWDDHEKEPGNYDFSDLDWQFEYAEAAGAKVSLALGLRQPRWPECHMPDWAAAMPQEEWAERLKDYMKVVIERYKDSPALESYQLENEFFMKVFGICPDHSRDRLIDEYNFVKALDPDHPVIISRSNNAVGLPIGEPQPDEFAVSVYKRTWDKTITKRYFEYPFPAWYYGFLAGIQKIVTGKDMIIHELQAEPWMPEGYDLKSSTIEEQNKSMDAERLRDRLEYGQATGMRAMYAWGVEWWYWRKVKFNDDSIWNAGRDGINRLSKSPNNCSQAYLDPEVRPPC